MKDDGIMKTVIGWEESDDSGVIDSESYYFAKEYSELDNGDYDYDEIRKIQGFYAGFKNGAESRQQEISELIHKLQIAESVSLEQAVKIGNIKADHEQEIAGLIEELETAQETITRYRQQASMIKSAWEDAKIENKQLLEQINRMEAKNEQTTN